MQLVHSTALGDWVGSILGVKEKEKEKGINKKRKNIFSFSSLITLLSYFSFPLNPFFSIEHFLKWFYFQLLNRCGICGFSLSASWQLSLNKILSLVAHDLVTSSMISPTSSSDAFFSQLNWYTDYTYKFSYYWSRKTECSCHLRDESALSSQSWQLSHGKT